MAVFALTYLNFLPDRSSFREKLVGITLITILCIVSGISWIVGSVYLESYHYTGYPEARSAYRFERVEGGGYQVRKTRFLPDSELGKRLNEEQENHPLPFSFPFYQEEFEGIYVHKDGMIGFEALPRWRDILHQLGPSPAIFVAALLLEDESRGENKSIPSDNLQGLFLKMDNGQVTVTWNRMVSPGNRAEEYSLQLKLYPSGVIEMLFIDWPDHINARPFEANQAPFMTGIVPPLAGRQVSKIRFDQSLPFEGNGKAAVIQNYRTDMLVYMDRIYAPIGYFILISTLIILIVFPMFFRINLEQPLKELLLGVRRIMAGNLDTSISVRNRDEIGYLARSFNEMAQAQNDLIHTLEDKVTKRTAEVTEYAAKNARLEERNHLARELHDAVSQTLFSANLIADTLPDLQRHNQEKMAAAVAEIRRLNKNALGEMRNLLLELKPDQLLHSPFGVLLRTVVEEVERNFSMEIDCHIEADISLPADVQLAFYRIAQECLTNAAKHARANTIKVYFDGIENQSLLSIVDDGIGFDVADIPHGHMGIQIMRERIEQIEGTLEIQSEPGNGAEISAIWFRDNDD